MSTSHPTWDSAEQSIRNNAIARIDSMIAGLPAGSPMLLELQQLRKSFDSIDEPLGAALGDLTRVAGSVFAFGVPGGIAPENVNADAGSQPAAPDTVVTTAVHPSGQVDWE